MLTRTLRNILTALTAITLSLTVFSDALAGRADVSIIPDLTYTGAAGFCNDDAVPASTATGTGGYLLRGEKLRADSGVDGDAAEAGGDMHFAESGEDGDVAEAGGEMCLAEAGGEMRLAESGGDVDVTESGGELHLAESGGDMDTAESGGDMHLAESGGDMHVAESPGIKPVGLPLTPAEGATAEPAEGATDNPAEGATAEPANPIGGGERPDDHPSLMDGDAVPLADADGLGELAIGQSFTETIKALVSYDPEAPMIFSSGLFLFLFAGFTLFYGLFRRKPVGRMVYILLFSLYFYYKSSGLYFLLVLLVATTDFFIGLWMGRSENQKLRKSLLWLSIIIDLGLLGYFKYTNFFIGIANDLFGKGFLDFRNIFLPVGISFFIFQSISYTIDIYRRRIEPLTCWLDYAFYLSFFPQLVAGPIVRARDFIPQIRQNPLMVTRGMFGTGVFLIATGLFKKAVISDYISLNFVDRIFDAPLLYSGFENLMGVYGYALQIYCDFSGYSDMAIGIALILGFRFNRNFDSPYKSATITEFWRRWHISLSSWLKDYLYISLGGNRKGKVRTYLNLMITMLLGGLWHGAALRFVFWGALHGASLAVHKFLMGLFPAMKPEGSEMKRIWRILGILFTFHLVCFGWIFFRAPDTGTAYAIMGRIAGGLNWRIIPGVITGYAGVFTLIAIGYLLHFTSEKMETTATRKIANIPVWCHAILLIAVIWIVMQIKSAGIQPFIYFQF